MAPASLLGREEKVTQHVAEYVHVAETVADAHGGERGADGGDSVSRLVVVIIVVVV